MTWQADSNGIFRWSSAFGVNANSARKVDANFGTISALLDAQTAALATHQGDTNNPHSVTKAQVGLGNVLDVAQEPAVLAGNPSQYYRGDKTWDTLDVGAVSGLGSAATHSATDFDPFGAAATVSVTLTAHVSDTNNPHQVTKAQVGLGNVSNLAQEPAVVAGNAQQYYRGDKIWADLNAGAVAGLGSAATHSTADFDTAGAAAVVSASLATHIADANNPHQVTKVQVGLGNVTNVAQEPAIVGGTALQFWRGDKTWQTLNTAIVPESVNLYFTNARALAAVPPAGTGTELQFRNGTAFGAVTGSSVSGSNVTIGGTLSINNTCLIGQNVGFGASTPGITFNGLGVFSNAAILNVISGNTGYLSHRPGGGNNFPQLFVNSMQGSTYFCGFNDSVPLSKFDVNGQLSCYGCNTTLSSLAVPTGLSVTPQGVTGGTAYGYAVTAVNAQGETVVTGTVTTATGNAILTAANKNHLVCNVPSGATSINFYRQTSGGSPATVGKIGTVAVANGALSVSFDDTGIAAAGAGPITTTGTQFSVTGWQRQTTATVVFSAGGGQSGSILELWNATDGAVFTFSSAGQATLKNLKVSGNVGFYNSNATGQQTVTGSRGANAALASLLTSLAATGLIVDSSSA